MFKVWQQNHSLAIPNSGIKIQRYVCIRENYKEKMLANNNFSKSDPKYFALSSAYFFRYQHLKHISFRSFFLCTNFLIRIMGHPCVCGTKA